jgi:hypothetical protein
VIFSTLSPDLAFLLKRAFEEQTSTQVKQVWQTSSPHIKPPSKSLPKEIAFIGHNAAH